MATNIPPHNLGEVIDACCALIDDDRLSIDEINEKYIFGPDFPTGGVILGRSGIRQAYHTGRGSVVIRGRATIEEIRKDRDAIVVTEIPYQVNKSRMIEKIAELVRDKRVEGISDIRDESDRDGVRVVVELRRDAIGQVVLNQLYRFSPLQTSFGINSLALNGGRPETMNILQMLEAFVEFREEVIRRRTVHALGKARDRAHVLVGLAIAVANIDEIISLIRSAADPVAAREAMLDRNWPAGDVAPLIELIDEPGHRVVDGAYRLSEIQARAILDLRLQRLTGLERDKVADELTELSDAIIDYLAILGSRPRRMEIMREELHEMKERFDTPRRTTFEENEFEHDIEDLIQREEMVVTVTHSGYIKRVPLSTYRSQRRGGKGRSGMSTKEGDFLTQVFVCDTHTPLLFFSSKGISYRLKVYRLPVATPQSRGKALVNLLPLDGDEQITTLMPMPEDEESWGELDIVFATASGNVRRNRLSDFTNIMANGKIAMKLDDGDSLVGVATCTEADDVMLAARGGKCIRFRVGQVRVFSGRTSTGVRGIRLAEGDEIVSMSIMRHMDLDTEERDAYIRLANARRRAEGGNGDQEDNGVREDAEPNVHLTDEQFEAMAATEQFILSITENGYGKRTSAYEYRVTNRGGQGIANIETSDRNGPMIAAFPVDAGDHIMLVTDGGTVIRCPVHDIRIAGRRTQGVTLFDTAEGEHVVSVARLDDDGEDGEDGEDDENGDGGDNDAADGAAD
jgi:DNA gyrase subunit A